MITLTSPPEINSVLGGNTLVPYNRLVLAPFSIDPVTLLINGTVRLISTANPTMQPILGKFTLNNSSGLFTIEVPQLDFVKQLQLSGPQITSVNTIIQNAQNGLEAGMITIGAIAGTQSTGV